MMDTKYLQQLWNKAKENTERFNNDNQALAAAAKMEKQPGYVGGTYLYIKATDTDDGNRPLSADTVFWLSPDVKLFDELGTRILSTDIKAGSKYTVQVTVSNGGDQDCHTCNTELYLADPLIGFGLGSSVPLGSKTVSVLGHSTTSVAFEYGASNDQIGHKCIFARVYSLTTNDYPMDWVNFLTAQDRHIGQQNLNIIRQNTEAKINVFLSATFNMARSFQIKISPDFTLAQKLKLPALGKYTILRKSIDFNAFKIAQILLPKTDTPDIPLPHLPEWPDPRPRIPRDTPPQHFPKSPDPWQPIPRPGSPVPGRPVPHLDLPTSGRTIPGLKTSETALPTSPGGHIEHAIEYESVACTRQSENSWCIQKDKRFKAVTITIPHLGLQNSQALPINVQLYDASGKLVGGVTYLVVG